MGIKDLFKAQRCDWIASARGFAIRTLKCNGNRPITIDDVLRARPLPDYLHRNTIGSVFRNDNTFQSVGFRKSLKPSANHRVIQLWILRVDEY
jgi:hypothetical protein